MEKDKERDRNSLRVCIREQGKKLEELIRVYEKIQKETARKKKDWKRIKSETEIH